MAFAWNLSPKLTKLSKIWKQAGFISHDNKFQHDLRNVHMMARAVSCYVVVGYWFLPISLRITLLALGHMIASEPENQPWLIWVNFTVRPLVNINAVFPVARPLIFNMEIHTLARQHLHIGKAPCWYISLFVRWLRWPMADGRCLMAESDGNGKREHRIYGICHDVWHRGIFFIRFDINVFFNFMMPFQ